MALLKKEKICSFEEFPDRRPNADKATRKVYYRVGELLTFKDDATGNVYQRIKLSILPNQVFYIFEEDQDGRSRS